MGRQHWRPPLVNITVPGLTANGVICMVAEIRKEIGIRGSLYACVGLPIVLYLYSVTWELFYDNGFGDLFYDK